MNIPTMNKSRAETIILEECVEMTWAGKAIPYYQELGYEYTGYHDVFWCRVLDLPPYSRKIILTQCPICNKRQPLPYEKIVIRGHTLCPGCSKTKDLAGMRFGRLRVRELDFSINKDDRGAYWMCDCDCGNTSSVKSNSLLRGNTTSCGCYAQEQASKRLSNQFGENNPNWNFGLTDKERIIGRNYPEYTNWRQLVYRKDDYTCQICGSIENIEAHHMYSYDHHYQHRLSVKYGLTMCHICHTDFHRWNGGNKKKCIPSDIDRWLYATDKSSL